MKILHCSAILDHKLTLDGKVIVEIDSKMPIGNTLKHLYLSIGMDYRKFFKMDLYAKTAIVLDHILPKPGLSADSESHTAVYISNHSGCNHTDRQFFSGAGDENFSPSPAIFVYTLPNIMIGEICIKNKIRGENVYFTMNSFDEAKLLEMVETLSHGNSISHCLAGWIEPPTDPFHNSGLWGKLLWIEL